MSDITTFTGRAQTLSDITSTATKHRFVLGEWSAGRKSIVLSIAESERVASELAAIIGTKCPPQVAAKRVARLLACYPSRASDNRADLEAYASVMLEEVQRFPDTILGEVLPEFSRAHPFRPSVAEVVMACQAEIDRLTVFKHGLTLMERHRTERGAQAAEAAQRKAASEKRVAEQDARAVRLFWHLGVRRGDIAGAERTFLMLPSGRGLSPWMKWKMLVLVEEWPERIANMIIKAGIFGLAELAEQREQASFNDLADIQSMVLGANIDGARTLLTDILSRPIEVPNVDAELPGAVSPAVMDLAMPFLGLLRDPHETSDGMAS